MAGIFGLLLSGAVTVVDQFFEYTTLLLPGNGTNGAQNNTFLDGSTNNFTITRNGNTTQGTFSPFSQTGWGNYFDGTGDWLNYTNTDNFGTSAFTVQAWIWFSATATNDSAFIDGRPTGGSSTGYLMAVRNSNKVLRFASATAYDGVTPLVANTWNHVAATYTGGTLRLYLNGNLDATFTGLSFNFTDTNFVIGKAHFASSEWTGYISNLQLVKGTALYTSSTYTVPTSPLTAISGTSLLTCQSNRFIDNSTNNFTITKNGDTSVVAFSPFNPSASWSAATYGGSGYFDGTGDYLTAPSNIVDFTAGQAFTVECWVYVSSNTPPQVISSNGANTFSFVIAGGQVQYGKSGVVDVLVGTMAAANQWVHVAVGRNSSNTSRLWVNGTSVATSGSDTYSFNAATMYIGSNATPAGYLNGYMAGLRVVKGSDVYGVANTSITVPTAPLTAITNTSLLLNFTNAGIYDATSKNDLETVGNAQISTTQSKWGGSSIVFDGTGDFLSVVSTSLLGYGTGNFTIEFWTYVTSTSNTPYFFDCRTTATANEAVPALYINGGNYEYYVSGAARITVGAVPTNQWVHVALVRNSGTTTLYSNGTSTGTYSDSTSYISCPMVIGQRKDTTSQSLNGYIQDFRVTKGYARYTANFTPPTAAFPTL